MDAEVRAALIEEMRHMPSRISETLESVDERVRAIARSQRTRPSSSTSGARSAFRCAWRAR
jgi:hypothetical protein